MYSAPVDTRERIIAWDRFLKGIRVFLHERGYYEVHTDHLVPAGAFEASIDSMAVRGTFGEKELHTSPEMEMKLLLSGAHLSLFQICRCFRDDPPTPVHRTEFTMLEYYRVFGTYEGLQNEVSELISGLSVQPLKIERKSVRELFLAHVGVELDLCQDVGSFQNRLRDLGRFHVSANDSWQDLFFKAWITFVEPALPRLSPTLVYDYPIQVAGLAAPSGTDERYSQRFEIYWHGMELCNGAYELRDAETLLRRHETETLLRLKEGKSPHPRPLVLLEALQRPLPECCGVAVGLERLFAALHEQDSI